MVSPALPEAVCPDVYCKHYDLVTLIGQCVKVGFFLSVFLLFFKIFDRTTGHSAEGQRKNPFRKKLGGGFSICLSCFFVLSK